MSIIAPSAQQGSARVSRALPCAIRSVITS